MRIILRCHGFCLALNNPWGCGATAVQPFCCLYYNAPAGRRALEKKMWRKLFCSLVLTVVLPLAAWAAPLTTPYYSLDLPPDWVVVSGPVKLQDAVQVLLGQKDHKASALIIAGPAQPGEAEQAARANAQRLGGGNLYFGPTVNGNLPLRRKASQGWAWPGKTLPPGFCSCWWSAGTCPVRILSIVCAGLTRLCCPSSRQSPELWGERFF